MGSRASESRLPICFFPPLLVTLLQRAVSQSSALGRMAELRCGSRWMQKQREFGDPFPARHFLFAIGFGEFASLGCAAPDLRQEIGLAVAVEDQHGIPAFGFGFDGKSGKDDDAI